LIPTPGASRFLHREQRRLRAALSNVNAWQAGYVARMLTALMKDRLTPAEHTGRGIGVLIGLLRIVGYAIVQFRRLPLGPNGKRVYKELSRRSRVLRGVLPILVLVGCGDLGWLIAGILT